MKTILVDAVFTFVSEEGVIFQELYDLLEKYPNPKVIVTNAAYEKYEQYSLNKMPYEVFTLQHDPEKTASEYFKTLLEHFGLTKDQVVYFEHNPEAVNSAESVGIVSYHYDENKKDLAALKDFLDQKL
jgi:FMN phosphatase YigB (HAD superfamily)